MYSYMEGSIWDLLAISHEMGKDFPSKKQLNFFIIFCIDSWDLCTSWKQQQMLLNAGNSPCVSILLLKPPVSPWRSLILAEVQSAFGRGFWTRCLPFGKNEISVSAPNCPENQQSSSKIRNSYTRQWISRGNQSSYKHTTKWRPIVTQFTITTTLHSGTPDFCSQSRHKYERTQTHTTVLPNPIIYACPQGK